MMNRTDFMSREEINKAILEVITTQFKKDAKEAHKVVEEAGYDIYKWDGSYRVLNKNISRYVYASENRRSTSIHTNLRNYRYEIDNGVRFDFVGYLNKPTNPESPYLWRIAKENRSTENYRRIYRDKNSIKNAQERIDKIKKEIASLTDDLIREVSSLKEAEIRLENTRKELGLKGVA